ncbi:hypothetical protein BD408DRAFT_415021 [Parasitella parasitica]|nr:hypothetical protein BD408DRAFT_415021 [Parasitella parasitica]
MYIIRQEEGLNEMLPRLLNSSFFATSGHEKYLASDNKRTRFTPCLTFSIMTIILITYFFDLNLSF